MKNVTIRNKQNIIISDDNLYDDPTEFIQFNVANNTFGKPERIVRAKIHLYREWGEEWVFLDGAYLDEDVIETIEDNDESFVKLRADYTIEITDYKDVPKSVTRRQAKRALHQEGLLEAVETYMETAPMEIKIDWNESQEIQRDWNSLTTVASALNLTDTQIDDLFILAKNL